MVPAVRFRSTASLCAHRSAGVGGGRRAARRGTLRDVLVELGYSVELAVRGAEALKLVPVFEPEVVLTGSEDVEVARATLRAGAFDYLGKPCIDVLARVVAAAVALPG